MRCSELRAYLIPLLLLLLLLGLITYREGVCLIGNMIGFVAETVSHVMSSEMFFIDFSLWIRMHGFDCFMPQHNVSQPQVHAFPVDK